MIIHAVPPYYHSYTFTNGLKIQISNLWFDFRDHPFKLPAFSSWYWINIFYWYLYFIFWIRNTNLSVMKSRYINGVRLDFLTFFSLLTRKRGISLLIILFRNSTNPNEHRQTGEVFASNAWESLSEQSVIISQNNSKILLRCCLSYRDISIFQCARLKIKYNL